MRKPRFISWISRALLAYSLASGANLAPQTSPTAPASPVHLTAEQDHQRLMDLLHITALRRGPDGDPKSPNAANVDESKVPTYALPDPLILKNRRGSTRQRCGGKIGARKIVEDFDREIYGRAPKDTPKVNWELTSTARENNEGVEVITRKLVGHVAEERNVAVPAVPAAKTKGSTGRQHVATARTLPTAEIAAAIVPSEGGFVVVLIVSVFTYARILSSRAHHIARKAHSRTCPCLSPVRR
jgi:hypothetical protein